MTKKPEVVRPRLGRPPATDSADTRRRILDIARVAFAYRGFGESTNRSLASEVGVTAGAIYHYFGSKLDLYLAVHEDVQDQVYSRFTEAVNGPATFREKLDAVLDAAHEMNSDDPTLAQFVGAVRVDMRRHPELAKALKRAADDRERFFDRIVDEGVKTGEIDPANEDAVSSFVSTILIGLTDAVSSNEYRHQRAVDAIKMLFDGTLVRSPKAARAVAAAKSKPSPVRAVATPKPAPKTKAVTAPSKQPKPATKAAGSKASGAR